MTSIDFISQMGGLLGLFLGFSLISGIEIMYWFTLRLGQRLFCNKNKK
jgi:amiloride-sensitive sodium channel